MVKKILRSKKATSHFDFVSKLSPLSKSKRSQITIFVILALAIVIVLILLFTGKTNLVAIFTATTPINQIKECVQEPVQEAIDILKLQGGSLDPSLYYLYQENKVEYLCYTEEYYKPCIVQKPLLKQAIEQQIQSYASPKIKNCISSVKANLERKGYQITMSSPQISISLLPGNLLVDLVSDIKIVKEQTESYKSIKTDMPSNLYNQIILASSIINWESKYGDVETIGYMVYYPFLKVEKKKQGDGTTIYIITDRDSEDKFMFASRSLVLPSGFTGQ
ncbi:MAG: hypothetical protein ACW98D_19050 [Promethearchaeota archaeon]|jgi:hypothetical protein